MIMKILYDNDVSSFNSFFKWVKIFDLILTDTHTHVHTYVNIFMFNNKPNGSAFIAVMNLSVFVFEC